MSISMESLALSGSLFIFTLLSGIWLSHAGRPLNSAIFGLHKIIAVATIFIICRHIYRLQGVEGAIAFLSQPSVLATAVMFLILVVSGSLMSFERPFPDAIHIVHKIAPVLALASAAAAYYLTLAARS